MRRSRFESHIVWGRGPSSSSEHVSQNAERSTLETPTRENVVSTSEVASDLPDSGSSSPLNGRLSTSVVIQLLFLVLFIAGVVVFVVQRRMRYKRLREQQQQMSHIKHISAPNGLLVGPEGNIPPSYHDALKSPVITASSISASNRQRQESDQALMEQCWAAVYDAEDGRTGHGIASNEESATPRAAPRTSQRYSISQWLRNHLRGDMAGSESDSGPLSRNPSARLPALPSPSYAGIPPTPTTSTPQTPMSATHLAPLYSPYQEPLSARSWMTGEDRLSIRASIPNSVLYPSPLQPAPPPRRPSQSRTERGSIDSVEEYGAGTWITITPHEDPPDCEPRRGDPSSVSPV